MLLTGTLRIDDLDFEVFQVSPGGELLDDVLVTRFPAAGTDAPFVRVAVFDPAENYATPGSRGLAHQAAATARKWLRAERDPLIGLRGAALEMHNPHIPYDSNPMTTVAWADVRAENEYVLLLNAGRCSDAEILISDDRSIRRLLTAPMLTPHADLAWAAAMDRTRASVPAHRWAPRRWHTRGELLSADDFVNPHLGLSGRPQPELFEGTDTPTLLRSIVLATDGLGLDQSKGEDVSVADRIAALMSRTPPPGMPYGHGDIAAVQITSSRGRS